MKSNAISSLNLPEELSSAVDAFAKSVAIADDYSAERLRGGRNSLVIKISPKTKQPFVIKSYVKPTAGARNRLESESKALRYINQVARGFSPKILGIDESARLLAMEFIDGKPIRSEEVNEALIEQIHDFIMAINKDPIAAKQADLPTAAEAFFSFEEIFQNIKIRLDRLQGVKDQYKDDSAFLHFLNDFNVSLEKVKKYVFQLGIPSNELLPESRRILSPSDIGFHNTILESNGRLKFIDFEYFGWDDPSKMISDFILQPEIQIKPALLQDFQNKITSSLGAIDWLPNRSKAALPVFALKWCMILLNEYLRNDLERRAHSAGHIENAATLRATQLAKAQKMLDKALALIA